MIDKEKSITILKFYFILFYFFKVLLLFCVHNMDEEIMTCINHYVRVE